MSDQHEEVTKAAYRMMRVLDTCTLIDIGPALTCFEVEALADVYRAAGLSETADELVEAHAKDDEPGDLHSEESGEDDE